MLTSSRNRIPSLLLIAFCCSLHSTVEAQAPDRRSYSDLELEVDKSIKPGDDFFGYANGAWLKGITLPAGTARVTARTELVDLTRKQLATVYEGIATAPAGSIGRKIADYRAAWLDVAAINAKQFAPLGPTLDSIARITDRHSLSRALGSGMPADVDPLNYGVYQSSWLLGLSVEQGNHGEKQYVPYLLQGGLGLERGDYLGTDAKALGRRQQYQTEIGQRLARAGFDRSAARAEAVLALESKIAASQATNEASANDHNSDNLWTRSDFTTKAPGMDWAAFFMAAGLSRQPAIVVWQPGAVTGAAALVGAEALESWKDYLRVRLLTRYAEVLPNADTTTPRAQRALDATQAALSEAIGRLYVERYFPATVKTRIRTIGTNVIGALQDRVTAVSWMLPATKAIAIIRLKTLYLGIGYPETWQDYADLTVDPADALGNLRRVQQRSYRRAISRLGKPVDRTEWLMAPQTVGAILTFQLNAYNFPGALLQGAKYDPDASEAANYGAIGAILGHETSHYIDLLGAEYQPDGAASPWWTEADRKQFQTASAPLVQQLSRYRPLPDLGINGTLVQSETTADLAGLMAAFDAYRRTLGSRASDSAYVRQQDRQFFLGFARSWRSVTSDEALRTQLTTDTHAPERYRIALVRNLDAWYSAFDVLPGDLLYLPPGERVKIW